MEKKINFIDYSKDEMFINLKKKMGIDLNKKFEWRIKKKINLDIDKILSEIKSKNGKIITNLSDLTINADGTLSYKNLKEKVILYINSRKDHDFKKYGFPKYHISYCETIEKYQNESNYVITIKEEAKPKFHIEITSETIKTSDEYHELSVCKNCLKKLNYKEYNVLGGKKAREIYENFSFKEFLELYKDIEIEIPELKKKYFYRNGNFYPNDWSEISRLYREHVNWKCEKCGKDCNKNRSELHVHHINRVKSNNRIVNLKALCKKCHSEEPFHEHLK